MTPIRPSVIRRRTSSFSWPSASNFQTATRLRRDMWSMRWHISGICSLPVSARLTEKVFWSLAAISGRRHRACVYGARVTAVDVSQACLKMARLNTRRYGSAGIRFEPVDEGERLPFADGEFDVVTCNSVLEYVRPGAADRGAEGVEPRVEAGRAAACVWDEQPAVTRGMHSREWFNNYIPRRFDRVSGRWRERGVSPWKLRREFGSNYDDLFTGLAGIRRYIELKRAMGLKGWKLSLLSALGAFSAISPVSVPLLLPYATVLLRKHTDGDAR